jgi:hypothetical protein
MLEVDVETPENVNNEALVHVVECVCVARQLKCTLKGTLASYPKSIHWHFKQGEQKGTLEITWWESQNRLWFKVADGRAGQWIEEYLPQIKEEIENLLR